MIGEADPIDDASISSIDYSGCTDFAAPEVPLTEHLRAAMEKIGITHSTGQSGNYGSETGEARLPKRRAKAKKDKKDSKAKMQETEIIGAL